MTLSANVGFNLEGLAQQIRTQQRAIIEACVNAAVGSVEKNDPRTMVIFKKPLLSRKRIRLRMALRAR